MIRLPRLSRGACVVALLCACAWRVLAPPAAAPADVSLAFFGWLLLIAQAIWTGIEVVGQVTLAALVFIVQGIWATLVFVYNGLVAFGQLLKVGLFKAWDFLRLIYDDVLKPGWIKFWRMVQTAKDWLQNFFGPVLRVLDRIRTEVLKFYKKFVQPVLDTIEIIRRMLRILDALHVPMANAIDEALGRVEAKIDQTFRLVLGKVNEVINAVNRIVTADGLFQRLALVRSIERDIKYVYNELHNARDNPLTDNDRRALASKNTPPDVDEMTQRVTEGFRTGRPALWSDSEWQAMNDAVFGPGR